MRSDPTPYTFHTVPPRPVLRCHWAGEVIRVVFVLARQTSLHVCRAIPKDETVPVSLLQNYESFIIRFSVYIETLETRWSVLLMNPISSKESTRQGEVKIWGSDEPSACLSHSGPIRCLTDSLAKLLKVSYWCNMKYVYGLLSLSYCNMLPLGKAIFAHCLNFKCDIINIIILLLLIKQPTATTVSLPNLLLGLSKAANSSSAMVSPRLRGRWMVMKSMAS